MAACSAGLLLGGARGRWGWTPPVGVNKAFVQRRVTPTRCGPACAQSTATDEDVIPARAKKTTAHVKAGDVDVYIIGISHVSRESVVQVRELIAAVKPDALVLELCKERVDLLVSEQAIDQSDPALMWHADGARIVGLPTAPGWPREEDLLPHLATAAGTPMLPSSDIDDDVHALLSTGLFRSVSARAALAPPGSAPSFVASAGAQAPLSTVPPLGKVEFSVTERILPQLTSLDIQVEGLSSEEAAKICRDVMSAPGPTVSWLLDARRRILQALGGGATAGVAFDGVENGAVVVRGTSAGEPLDFGFASSARLADGSGWGVGIQPPRDLAPPDAKSRARAAREAAGPVRWPGRRTLRTWTVEERRALGGRGPDDTSRGGLPDQLVMWMTRSYAEYQAAAGRVVGIQAGEAWRAATEEACRHDVKLVVLGDRPTDVTRERLANAIVKRVGLQSLAAVAAGVAVPCVAQLAQGAAGLEAYAAGVAVALVTLAPVLWQVWAPIAEVKSLSQLGSAKAIEKAVDVPEPLQGKTQMTKLWGEDALIDWPGAIDPIIHERDRFMAAVLRSLADGLCRVPVLVATNKDGKVLLEYGAITSSKACPLGTGKGAFEYHSRPKRIVAVVGTAHVGGMLANWEKASRENLDDLL